MCQFPGIGKFDIIVDLMEATLVYDYWNAYNIMPLTSNLYWGQRPECENPCFWSKIRSMSKWPISSLRLKNTFAIWYLNENELIRVFRGHVGHKQPRNYKFKYGWAWAKPTLFHLNTSVDFFSCLISWSCTYSESWQNFCSIAVLHVSVTSVLKCI